MQTPTDWGKMYTKQCERSYVRILFVIPKSHEWPHPGYPHTGIAYLAAVLKQRGMKIKILDMRLGYTFANLFKVLDEFNPDVVGLTCYSYFFKNTYELVSKIKSQGDYIVVIGGPHVSAIRGKVLAETKADFAVKGEGEYTFPELCKAIEKETEDFKEIEGLIWRRKSEVVENVDRPFIEDLDTLPFPDYEEFELEKYMCYIEKRLPIITSRGCPYRCIYCSVKISMGNMFRARSPDNVINEMKYWYGKGWRSFDINDDCFSLNMKRAKKICDLIIEKGLKITYKLYNGIRVDRTDMELLQKMKASGCDLVQYGVESGNEEVLKMIKKGITLEQAKKAVENSKAVGIRCVVNFIIGHPGENFEKAMDSIRLAKMLPADSVCFYNLVPYPGTELFEWVEKNATFLYSPEIYLNEVSYGEGKPIFETREFPAEKRREVLRKGFLLYRKKILQSKLGWVPGSVAYLVSKSNILWKIGVGIFSGTKMGRMLLKSVAR